MSYLTSGLSDAGLEPCALKVYSAIPDTDIGANVVHGEIWLQGAQTIRVSDTSAHPLQFLSVRAVR